jgi:hypothetical protein
MILLRKPARRASNHHTVSRLPNARLAQTSDLTSLLELYQFSEVSRGVEPERASRANLGRNTVSRRRCGLRLLRGRQDRRNLHAHYRAKSPARWAAVLVSRNVVTHPEFRCQGHGSAVLRLQVLGPRAVITSSFEVARRPLGASFLRELRLRARLRIGYVGSFPQKDLMGCGLAASARSIGCTFHRLIAADRCKAFARTLSVSR